MSYDGKIATILKIISHILDKVNVLKYKRKNIYYTCRQWSSNSAFKIRQTHGYNGDLDQKMQ